MIGYINRKFPSFEIKAKMYIILLSVVDFFLSIYIYIYSHPQRDYFVVIQLFSMARHVGHLKLGSKPAQLYIRLSIIQLDQQVVPRQRGN